MALLTFIISLLISYLFQSSLAVWISLVLLTIVVLIGFAFDIIGTAVMAATEAPFHAMGADRINGSKQSIFLIRHADQVANFCTDVVGDISGTIGGAIILGISLRLVSRYTFLPQRLFEATAIAIVAAFTVGGKAVCKAYALENANQVIFTAGKMLYFFKILNGNRKKQKRKNHRNGPNPRKARKN